MNKKLKGILVIVAGFLATLANYAVAVSSLGTMTIASFLVYTILIPGCLALIASFAFALVTKESLKGCAIAALANAVIETAASFVFGVAALTPEVIQRIVSNTTVSASTSLSVQTGSNGDILQTALIFLALSGVGAFFGAKISSSGKSKKDKTPLEESYDTL